MTDITSGISTVTAAVFDIHIDMNAASPTNVAYSRTGPAPALATMLTLAGPPLSQPRKLSGRLMNR